mgnify:CR=1 FL=1
MESNGVKRKGMTVPQKHRRERALKRLKSQLEKGKKRTKEDKLVNITEKDIKRINKEIETLKSRI